MSIRKSGFCNMLLLFICSILCLSLFGCRNYDDIVLNFYKDTRNGKYNSITLDLGENNSGIYFIDEYYGIWSISGEKYLFGFNYVPRTQRGGELKVILATEQSYYRSIVQQANCTFDEFSGGKLVFSGRCEFSDNETVATISPDNIYVNEMFIEPEYTVVMEKTSIPDEEIVPLEVALSDMHFVPDTYFEFLSDRNSSKFSCEMADLWIDGSTMTGEWSTNGSIIPIRMKIDERVPYVEIFDVRGSSEKRILKAYAKVIDGSSIELIQPEGDIFYETPTTPVVIHKTS